VIELGVLQRVLSVPTGWREREASYLIEENRFVRRWTTSEPLLLKTLNLHSGNFGPIAVH
jgi:hypothetical protein